MILNAESEGIISEPDLFDDLVARAPGLDLEAFTELSNSLMMRAVHFGELMRCLRVETQPLNIVVLLFRQFMTGNIELERAAKRDVEKLHPFANCENRQTARERLINRCKFPAVPHRIDIFLENARIRNF